MLLCRRAASCAVGASGKGTRRTRAIARATGNLSTAASTRAVRSTPQALGAQLQQHRYTWAVMSGASQSFNNHGNGHKNADDASRATWNGVLLMASGLIAAAAAFSPISTSHQTPAECDAAPQSERAEGQLSDQKKVYPIVSKAEVAKHTSKEAGGAWVTYDGGVYDITEFIANHPGGSARISMAAGGALEPFWKLYALHKKDEVLDILATLRIGSLSEEDMADEKEKAKARDSDDPYAKDPERYPFFVVNSAHPFNAEPPRELLVDAGFITPNELYYVRNHLPVPTVDPEKYRLQVEVEGKAARCLSYSLDDLKTKFPHVKVVTAIQCAGNRREDMTAVKAVKGLGWSCGAVSNCEWTGVRLRDVLKHAGVNVDEPERDGIEHVQFEGLDRDLTTCYGSSILAETALDRRGDVILAFEMNGEAIPRDHGFPIRAVVPGVVGARNVKWLAKVIASGEESKNHWQQNDYKGFCCSDDWDTADFSKSPAIQELPVNSAILSPADGSTVSPHDEEVTIRGYALSGGGRAIVRVDVSADGGETWQTAELKPTGQPLHRTYAWTLWEASVPVPKNKSEMKVVCKAIDSGYNSQPERAVPIWNIRGVLSNSWHGVALKIEDEE